MLTVAAPIAQLPPVAQPQLDALRNSNARFEPIPEPQQNSGSTRPRSEADDYDQSRAAVQPRDNISQNQETLDPRAVSERGSNQENSREQNANQRDPQQREQQRQEQAQISQLSAQDRAVRAHEAAHSTVGGQYAGAPQFQFTRGPDGRSYAVAGEVSIDASPVPGDPEATIRKLQTVQRAALAPVDPSSQDVRVAASASSQIAKARAELLREARANGASESPEKSTPAESASTALKEEKALPGATVTTGSDTLYVNCPLCSKPHLQASTHTTTEKLSSLAFGQKLQSTGAFFPGENVYQRSA